MTLDFRVYDDEAKEKIKTDYPEYLTPEEIEALENEVYELSQPRNQQPKFKTCEIVVIVTTNPKRRRLVGICDYIPEVIEGRDGKWLYELGAPLGIFHEDELESTGQFD